MTFTDIKKKVLGGRGYAQEDIHPIATMTAGPSSGFAEDGVVVVPNTSDGTISYTWTSYSPTTTGAGSLDEASLDAFLKNVGGQPNFAPPLPEIPINEMDMRFLFEEPKKEELQYFDLSSSAAWSIAIDTSRVLGRARLTYS